MSMSVIALIGLLIVMFGFNIYMYLETRKTDRELDLFIHEATTWRDKYYRLYNLWRYGSEEYTDNDSDYD